jgi:hypothetical protein
VYKEYKYTLILEKILHIFTSFKISDFAGADQKRFHFALRLFQISLECLPTGIIEPTGII